MDPVGEHGSVEPPVADLATLLTRLERVEAGLGRLGAEVETIDVRLRRAGIPMARPAIAPIHTQAAPPVAPAMAAPAAPPIVRPSVTHTAAWSPVPPAAAAVPAASPRPWPPQAAPGRPDASFVVEPVAGPVLSGGAPQPGSLPQDEIASARPMADRESPTRVPSRHVEPARQLPELSPGRVLAWVGGAAIVLGAVFFLSLAFSRGWITEPMRVLLGLVAGAALLGGSVLVFDRRQPVVGQVLAAVGIAILELSCFAARSFGLVGPEPALLATALVATAATAIAIRFDAQPVAALGFLAVLAAPPIMGAPATLPTVGFLGIVLVASCAVAVARGWRWLSWLAFVVTLPQLLSWLWGGAAPELLAGAAAIAWWLTLGLAALGEAWRRPRPVLRDPTAALILTLDVALLGLLALTLEVGVELGAALVVVALLHLGAAAGVLTRRSPRDEHGQLLVAAGAPFLALGLYLWLPLAFVLLALAFLAVGLGRLATRFGHRVAGIEALVAAGITAAFLLTDVLPAGALLTIGFPPSGAATVGLPVIMLLVAGLLAAILAGARWSVATRAPRGAVLGVGVALIAWTLMFEVSGLWLLTSWTVLAAATAVVSLRASERDGHGPLTDPLLGAALGVGACAVAWSLAGFRLPPGPVDVISGAVAARILASVVPIVGLGVVLVALRRNVWRGGVAAAMVLLGSFGVALLTAGTTFRLGGTTASGDLAMLVGWAVLALLSLILDERPRLRLARSGTDAVRDPAGHPLALAALVPAFAMLVWLVIGFLTPGAGGSLPAVPFVDDATLATLIVVLAVLAGARVATTWLVRATLVATAVALVAVLLPLEVTLELAIVGWSALAAGAFLVGRRLGGPAERLATGVGAVLVAIAAGATLLVVAPLGRLFPDASGSLDLAGPPNAATLATLATAVALAVGAWCRRQERLVSGWLWVGAAGMVGWAVSVGIVDAFAVGLPGAADPAEAVRQAQVALSIAWAAMGLAALLVGLALDLAPFRQAGLGLLAIATIKVFAYDLATLDIAYRVLSLVGLGVLLLVSAWFYLHGRHRGGPQPLGG